MPWNGYDFHLNTCIEKFTSLEGANEIVHEFFYDCLPIWMKFSTSDTPPPPEKSIDFWKPA